MNEKPPKDPTPEELERQKAELEEKQKDAEASISDEPLTLEEQQRFNEYAGRIARLFEKMEKEDKIRRSISELLKQHGQDWQEANVASQLAMYESDSTETAPKREAGPEIEKFENLITAFEADYPLEELHAITDLTPEEALRHPLREPAKKALNPIVALLNKLKEETDIPSEEYEALKAEYKRLSRAVGMINNGKVDHER
jgi:hypothetical protein